MKLASTVVIATAVEYAHKDLDRAVELWGFVAEQKLAGGLPSAGGDTLTEDEARARRGIEGRDRQAQLTLLDALHRLRAHTSRMDDAKAGVEDAVKRVRRARLALGAQAPAVEAALNAHAVIEKAGVGPDGRPGTSGVSLDEAERQRKGAVEAEAACLCCHLGVSEVGRLRAGFCKADYDAWWRAGQPDRGPWIIERRQYLEGKAAGEAEIIQLRTASAYKNLRDVA